MHASEQIPTSLENVLYKTPQELTTDEVNQVRLNIHSVGQYATGLTYIPYTVVETGVNTSETYNNINSIIPSCG